MANPEWDNYNEAILHGSLKKDVSFLTTWIETKVYKIMDKYFMDKRGLTRHPIYQELAEALLKDFEVIKRDGTD